ncbi:unnamed protein product (macronuclear) [Paramecium tetraurelia]|uniref:Uncharacterized protein n=1 Tax=Paramecium tetraurelia TaxID=5888 RepID=A0DWQ3_PARTE|nr:uncharacterized protein GSPATT00021113001 [Paramecium tetraurelia]CAK87470.1 unnamed protein product [Paramecium tetraurelia]|eukprot:XP_001454867.1 hypothetical protein (macronuclear) [Paramecium tetraurelia strain d4-2]
MNQLELKAVHSLLKLAREEETITQRDWEPQSPMHLDQISPQPKTLNYNRRKVRVIPNLQGRQRSSVEMNYDCQQHSELPQKENSLQQIIEEYMKQIRQTQRQIESIHKQKFDLKSGWMNFSSIILENKQKLTQKHKRSSLELQLKENNQQKVQQQQSFKKTSLQKVLNNESFFLPKLRSTYLK